MTYFWDRGAGHAAARASRAGRPASPTVLAAENARRTLETGVTTVRDLGASGDDRLRDARPDQHRQDGRAADVRRRPGALGAARRRAEARLRPAGRGAGRGRIRLGQGLRLARQLSERRHHADAHLRGDEGRGRCRPREEPSGRDSFLRTVRREGRRARRRRFDRARHRSRRRDDRRHGEARHGLGADDRSQPLLRRREGRVRLRARHDPAAAGLHREEPRVDAPRVQGRREDRHGLRRGLHACSARTRASSAGSSRPG